MKEIVEVMITTEEINRRLDELAAQINADYAGKTVSLICILKGGVTFMVDLARRLTINVEYDFMDISSYGNEMVSSGVVKIMKDLDEPITDKNVILVEDIIDTGRTLERLRTHLSGQKPASLKVCTLLDKPGRRVVPNMTPDYIGFTIEDKFVIGYGLDYAQRYRNLNYIGILHFEE